MLRRVLILVTLVLVLAGCESLFALRDSLRQKATDTADQIGQQYEKTKESVEQKVQDVKDAVNKTGDAVDALKKVTQ